MTEKQSVALGTLVLTASSVFNRLLGFVYQVLMVRLLRAEGIGLFSMIYPIYMLFLVVASAGIPVAIAKLVAEENARNNQAAANRIFKISLTFILVFALLITFALVVYSPRMLAAVFDNPDVNLAFMVMIPGILIVSVCSAFRGYFQGLQQMTPTAITQAVEQTVRVVSGLLLAYLLMPRGIAWATAGASAGVVLGEFVGFLLMLAIFLTRRPSVPTTSLSSEPLGVTCRRIFSLASPVTVTRVVATALLSVDAVLITKRLVIAGLSAVQATAAYGKFSGMALTLLTTPGILTISLATALVPAVSNALAQRDGDLVLNRIGSALRLTMLIGVPAAVLFLILPEHLCNLLFGYPDAGLMLAVVALSAPFLYLIQTTTGILQGMGKAMQPLHNMLIASVFKIIGIYYLTAIPALQINGAAFALALHFVIMAVLNVRDIGRLTGYRLDYVNSVGKPVLAAVAMGIVINWLQPSPDSALGTGLAMLTGLTVYGVIVVFSGALAREETMRLHYLFNHLLSRGSKL